MSKQMDQCVLVVDVESTAWEPKKSQPKNEISEIIEIGITVVNTTELKIISSDAILVRPQKSKLSKFCTKLTTLTQDMVDEGITFAEAAKILKNKYNSENRTLISWGDYDRKMFERNSRDYGIKYPFGPRHMNLKNTFTILHSLSREPSLGEAMEYLKLKFDGTQHRGIDDSRNIATILLHTLKQFAGV